MRENFWKKNLKKRLKMRRIEFVLQNLFVKWKNREFTKMRKLNFLFAKLIFKINKNQGIFM